MRGKPLWMIGLMILCLLAAGCAGTITPSPTITPVVTITTPAPDVKPLVVAGFDGCTGTNDLGGAMGAAYNTPDSLKESFVPEVDRGCVARIEYDITAWAAFWMKLQDADLTPYSRLFFDIRADATQGVPGSIKLELKRDNEVSIQQVGNITDQWQTLSVKLADFRSAGYGSPLSSWQGLDELVFTFEAGPSGRQGLIFLDNLIFASDSPPTTVAPPITASPAPPLTAIATGMTSPTPSIISTITPTHTPTSSVSVHALTLLLDDFSPQPAQGDRLYYFTRMDGDRGAINDSAMAWGRGQVTATIAAGNTWGGGWLSLNHPMREGLPIDFSAILPAQILPAYQGQITGITARIVRGAPGRTFRLELKDHGAFRWTDEIILNGGEQVISAELPALGEINELVWVLDHAAGGDTVVLDSITFTATTSLTDTATAAFVWSYGQLLNSWNPETGLVRDKARDASGDFDAVQVTGSLAAATAMAAQLGVVARDDAVAIVDKIGQVLLTELPRAHGLGPHFVRVSPEGAIDIVPGTEWSSIDSVIAAIGLLTAKNALGLDTAATEQMLRKIDWDDLTQPDGMISMGYTYQGERIPWAWDIFGSESFLVEMAYASVTGDVAPLTYPSPPIANGSGFIDELAWLFVPSPISPDYWNTDWATYRSGAADKQIGYYPSNYGASCFAQLVQFGLSASEGPDPSRVPPGSIYQAFGVGGRDPRPNDGAALLGAPVVTPHYAALIASLRPEEAIRMWEWLIEHGFFTPLNNVESLMFPPGAPCDPDRVVWNHMKGSWNLALQTLGWGRYLAERQGLEPVLWRAATENRLLRGGYCLLAKVNCEDR